VTELHLACGHVAKCNPTMDFSETREHPCALCADAAAAAEAQEERS
jgi:hypothetical protein